MGLFNFSGKNIEKSKLNIHTNNQTTSYKSTVPPLQGDYAKTVFLNAYSKPSPIKNDCDYQQYLLYECGIKNPSAYHRALIDEGYLSHCPLTESLKSLKVDELKTILSEHNLKLKGKKEELINRIIENIDESTIYKYCQVDLYSITEKGRKFLDTHIDYVQIHRHKNWEVDWKEYDSYKKPGYNFSDTMWSIFNDRLRTCDDFGRNAYFCMYNLLVEEHKEKNALEILLRILYIDLSGAYLSKRIDTVVEFYIDNIYSWEELQSVFSAEVFLAPIFVTDIAKYKAFYNDSIVDKIYEWKLPMQLCSKQLFLEIVHSILDETYDEESVMNKLNHSFNKMVNKLIKEKV